MPSRGCITGPLAPNSERYVPFFLDTQSSSYRLSFSQGVNKRETVVKLLHIDSSIQGEGSASRELTREIVARFKAERPDTEVTYLDLAAQELPHLSQKSLVRADELEAARTAEALEQFLAADAIVIGAPVYNFTIPSQLKAWIDRITVAGKTFRYTESGPQGLAGGKQVTVAVARRGGRARRAARGVRGAEPHILVA